MFVRRSRSGWSPVQGNRWSFLVDKLIRFLAGKEPGHPLHSGVGLSPVPSNPLLIRRNRTPHAAYPQILSRVFIPPPVTWNP